MIHENQNRKQIKEGKQSQDWNIAHMQNETSIALYLKHTEAITWLIYLSRKQSHDWNIAHKQNETDAITWLRKRRKKRFARIETYKQTESHNISKMIHCFNWNRKSEHIKNKLKQALLYIKDRTSILQQTQKQKRHKFDENQQITGNKQQKNRFTRQRFDENTTNTETNK